MANTILISIIVLASIALVFSKQLHALIVRAQLTNSRTAGVRILIRRDYVDVNAGGTFSAWHNVSGLRLKMASLILKA